MVYPTDAMSPTALTCRWASGITLQEISHTPGAFTGRSFRSWLLELRNSHSLIKSSRSALIDRLLEGYDNARHGTGVCSRGVRVPIGRLV
jgi:hypothetical protein